VAAAGFAATSPYTFLDWTHAREQILFEVQHMRMGEEPARSADPNGWLFHGLGLTLTTCGATLVALCGLVALCFSRLRRAALPLALFAVLWFVMISLANVRYGRYEVALTPVLALLVAALPAALLRQRVGWRLVGTLLPVLVVGLAVGTSALMVLRLQNEKDPRDASLRVLLSHVPPGGSVGLAWDPWFNAPPIDPQNGGTVLRQNPFWGQLCRPLRPVVVTGLDGAALEREQPQGYALGNFEIRDALRLGQAPARRFREVLTKLYLPAGVLVRPAPLSGVLGWAPPQDWLYPFPEITVYALKLTPAAPAQPKPARPPTASPKPSPRPAANLGPEV
jgi:hypothetical protein